MGADFPANLVLVLGQSCSPLVVDDAEGFGVFIQVVNGEQITAVITGPDGVQARRSRASTLVRACVSSEGHSAVGSDFEVADRRQGVRKVRTGCADYRRNASYYSGWPKSNNRRRPGTGGASAADQRARDLQNRKGPVTV